MTVLTLLLGQAFTLAVMLVFTLMGFVHAGPASACTRTWGRESPARSCAVMHSYTGPSQGVQETIMTTWHELAR
jgi:hypothetical protein